LTTDLTVDPVIKGGCFGNQTTNLWQPLTLNQTVKLAEIVV
jgi:hypothetical protein